MKTLYFQATLPPDTPATGTPGVARIFETPFVPDVGRNRLFVICGTSTGKP